MDAETQAKTTAPTPKKPDLEALTGRIGSMTPAQRLRLAGELLELGVAPLAESITRGVLLEFEALRLFAKRG